MRRRNISKKIRFEVFKRDGFTCQYCGRSAPDVFLQIDHIKPVASGGEDDVMNYATACAECNAGKGARELDDHSVIEKQRKQLEELNERRLQLEMMLGWREELKKIDDDQIAIVADKIDLIIFEYDQSVTETGRANIKKWIRRFSLRHVLDAIDDAEEKISSADEIDYFFDLVGRIANVRKRAEKTPYLKDLYYIRGILRNRLQYVNEWQAIVLMREAVEAGWCVEEIKEVALTVSSWTQFRNTLEAYEGDEQDG